MNLNIIGNGFDLYHGLPSSYYYFGCYLAENDHEFYEEICSMYNRKYREMIEPFIAHDFECVVENIFWSDFESRLSSVDDYFIVETSQDDLDLENPDPTEIVLDKDINTDKIKEKFVQWVSDTIDISTNYKQIREILGSNELEFGDEDCFLQFNYTHSLQEIYGIKNNKIHYVHGECLENDESELIVGHGNDDRVEEIKDKIEELKKKYNYTQSSYNRINEYECLLRYIRKLRKNVSGCIFSCNDFYSRFDQDVEHIYVYGHSLGSVDIPYLVEIRQKWPDAKWHFSYHSETDKDRINKVVTRYLNLIKDEVREFEFINELSNVIRNEIVNQIGIVEYKKV